MAPAKEPVAFLGIGTMGHAMASSALRAGLPTIVWNRDPRPTRELAGLGAEVAATPPIVCRNLGRELMYPLFVLRGPKSCALKQWPSFWKSLCEIFRIGRGDRFYNWRRDDLRVFIGDCYYTVRDQIIKSKG